MSEQDWADQFVNATLPCNFPDDCDPETDHSDEDCHAQFRDEVARKLRETAADYYEQGRYAEKGAVEELRVELEACKRALASAHERGREAERADMRAIEAIREGKRDEPR